MPSGSGSSTPVIVIGWSVSALPGVNVRKAGETVPSLVLELVRLNVTFPVGTVFRRTLTIQRTTRAERTILRHNTFTRYADGRIEERAIDNADARAIARDEFGVTLPDRPLVYEGAGT